MTKSVANTIETGQIGRSLSGSDQVVGTERVGRMRQAAALDLRAEVASGFDKRDAERMKLKLVSIWINENPLKNCLNQDANSVREAMAKEGNDARIASSILVATTAELAQEFASSASGSVTVSALGNEIGVSVGSGKSGTTTIRLAENTTFAYGLHKVKKWSKGKTQIEDLEDDWYGGS